MLGPKPGIVIADRHLVKELVDKRSAKYNNRFPISAADLVHGGDHLVFMQMGDRWRMRRKLIHQHFMDSAVEKKHIPLINAEAVQMMHDFCVEPGKHMIHPKRYSNSIIMSLLYSTRTPTSETPHMKSLYRMTGHWDYLAEPGNAPPIDFFPIVRYLPERWFKNWKTWTTNVRKDMTEFCGGLLEKVQKRRAAQGSKNSFMDIVLDQNDKLGMNDHELAFLGEVMMEGGSDTSSNATVTFIHAMTKYPEVLKKAQAEIDSVVGEERSPVWSDYSKLQYITQIVKETMRWRPVLPQGIGHAAAEDDWINGMFIPKGALIMINSWGLHYDESRWKDPWTYNPDRYEGITALASELANASDVDKRDHYGYGAGRRICPGIHLAERTLWLAIAKLIWAFDIGPGMDEKGEVIEPDVKLETAYAQGLLLQAKSFPCTIVPRSQARKVTIMREFEQAKVEVFSRYEE